MKKAIIFLTKSQLSFYGSNLAAMAVLDLPPTLFQDMEIVNKDEFSKTVTTFIETNKIQPAEFFQVLNSDLVIEKDISLQPVPQQAQPVGQPATQPVKEVKIEPKGDEKIKQEINDFLNIVPFENTLQFTNKKDKKLIKIYVANKDIFETIKTIFETKGFICQGITALPLLGENPVNTLDPHAAKNLLSHYESFKSHQFPIIIESVKEEDTEMLTEEEKPEGSSNKGLIGILLIIVLVLGGLGYVIWTQFATKPTRAKIAMIIPTSLPAVISPTLDITPTGTTNATASATLEKKETTIQILNGSGVAGQADQIKNDFTKAGFTDVTTGNANGVTLSKTLVVFKKTAPASTRDKITEVLKPRFPDISVKESEEATFDVSITTVRIISPTPSPSPKP